MNGFLVMIVSLGKIVSTHAIPLNTLNVKEDIVCVDTGFSPIYRQLRLDCVCSWYCCSSSACHSAWGFCSMAGTCMPRALQLVGGGGCRCCRVSRPPFALSIRSCLDDISLSWDRYQRDLQAVKQSITHGY